MTSKTSKTSKTAAKAADLVAPPADAAPSPGLKPDSSKYEDPTGPLAETVRVIIRKDETTSIPKRVFAHEVIILQTIWGEDKIEVVEGSELDQHLTGDAGVEHERLLRVYGRKGEAAVLRSYPTPSLLAQSAGIKLRPVNLSSKKGKTSAPQSAQRGGGVA